MVCWLMSMTPAFDYVFDINTKWTQYVMIQEDTALTDLEKRYGIIFLTIRSIIMTVSKCL